MAHPVLPTGGAPDENDMGHLGHHDELHGRFNNSVEILSGTTAARPAAGAVEEGTLYWNTDTETLHRSNGATWDDLTSGVSDHGALTGLADDDHPQYLTQAEADALYEDTGAVATHAAAGDPHTGYRLESADHTHQTTGLQAGKIDHGAALDGLADDDHTQYHTAARHASVDAADHSSGAAADGTVLTADGAGGAAWEAAAGGGAPEFVDVGVGDTAINSLTDVTLLTRSIPNIAVGDLISVRICGRILNNSGGAVNYTWTLDLDNALDPELQFPNTLASGVSDLAQVIIEAEFMVVSTSDVRFHLVINYSSSSYGGGPIGSGAAARRDEHSIRNWDTAAADVTGTSDFVFKVRSTTATATQTFTFDSIIIRKESST